MNNGCHVQYLVQEILSELILGLVNLYKEFTRYFVSILIVLKQFCHRNMKHSPEIMLRGYKTVLMLNSVSMKLSLLINMKMSTNAIDKQNLSSVRHYRLGFLGLHRRPMFDYFFLPMAIKLLFIICFSFIFDIVPR